MKKPKRIFYLDIPKVVTNPNDGEWQNIDIFDTRKEAQKFLLDTWGIQEEHSEIFITEGTE